MPDQPRIICLGAMLWDVIGHSPVPLAHGDDVAGRIHQRPGGVALNVAIALARLGLSPAILSAVGRDAPGDSLIHETARHGVAIDWLYRDGPLPTDLYMAIEAPGGLVAAIADAHGLEAAGLGILGPMRDGTLGSAQSPWQGVLVVDGNPTLETLALIAADPCLALAELRIVPASPDKATRLAPLLKHPSSVFHINRLEAEALAGRRFHSAVDAAEAVVAMGASRVIVTDGPRAAADAMQDRPTLTLVPPPIVASRVTGAGDAFLAAHLAAELSGADRQTALAAAIDAASTHVTAQDATAPTAIEKDIA
ncbi:PfkB family carbohydrate kinase [Paracoccus laeviglucosivorans]|uniref:Sugar or nucleoside kinase, ribokinase family n=1 Tax=Paracoccus laeviglucosivorans TaxID=1197861 RepID=A0A521BZP8_9RHOB|nr:PfkB family carbohydrate kinase [Paracoccus laeviglucosivorans]SMO52657.1 Sugar or nucleoside kinase, ribokinase family [Paracoccus laeviglucosivorans]